MALGIVPKAYSSGVRVSISVTCSFSFSNSRQVMAGIVPLTMFPATYPASAMGSLADE